VSRLDASNVGKLSSPTATGQWHFKWHLSIAHFHVHMEMDVLHFQDSYMFFLFRISQKNLEFPGIDKQSVPYGTLLSRPTEGETSGRYQMFTNRDERRLNSDTEDTEDTEEQFTPADKKRTSRQAALKAPNNKRRRAVVVGPEEPLISDLQPGKQTLETMIPAHVVNQVVGKFSPGTPNTRIRRMEDNRRICTDPHKPSIRCPFESDESEYCKRIHADIVYLSHQVMQEWLDTVPIYSGLTVAVGGVRKGFGARKQQRPIDTYIIEKVAPGTFWADRLPSEKYHQSSQEINQKGFWNNLDQTKHIQSTFTDVRSFLNVILSDLSGSEATTVNAYYPHEDFKDFCVKFSGARQYLRPICKKQSHIERILDSAQLAQQSEREAYVRDRSEFMNRWFAKVSGSKVSHDFDDSQYVLTVGIRMNCQ
jgi:hypothetical protein